MLIDWFTVGAQAINFLVLVWLLKRYLYKPVLAAIDARETKVAARIKDAETQEAKSQAAGEELRKRSEAFEQEREALMHKAVEEGAAERQRLIESARQDSELLRVKLQQSLAAERAELGRQLALRTQAEVFALTRKALTELAGATLEDRMIEVLIARLHQMPEQQGLAPAGTTAAQEARIRCAHDPSPAERAQLETAVRERLGAATAVRFETAPELVCGLEISVNGVKLAWSVADYLSTLDQEATALAATLTATASEPAHVH